MAHTNHRAEIKIQMYIVKKSETLSSIAASYGTTPAVLRALNKLKKIVCGLVNALKYPIIKLWLL